MMNSQTDVIDWKRIEKALRQMLRNVNSQRSEKDALANLQRLLEFCGPGSLNRPMIVKIAKAALVEQSIVYAPCCPDYSHLDGRYTFRGLDGGISLLAELHIAFLERLAPILPNAQITLLLANQEAEDAAIIRAVGTTREEFQDKLYMSLTAIRTRIGRLGWEAKFMTDVIPDLVTKEKSFAQEISNDNSKRVRLQTELGSRMDMYRRIDNHMLYEEMMRRTVRTAAQYLTLGEFAFRENALVCNHTTTNLSWYGETNAAILHNPVSVY
ncbi:MAG: hypothetical protein PHS79_02720 [Patescibacteria group bacterium]|nr:hypothetical protein [Patescibacteria group bacterium]